MLRRDGHRCQWPLPGAGICGGYANQVDHRVAKTDDDRPSQLWSLCKDHHATKSAHEGGAGNAARQARRYRPSEPHPATVPKETH